MLYWLYTDGQRALSALLIPLLCLTLILPIVLSLVLGRGIQRSESGGQTTAIGWRKLFMFFTFVVVMLAVTALYVTVTRGIALARSTGGKPLTSEFLIFLTGGPAWISPQRLLLLGSLCLMLNFFSLPILRETARNAAPLPQRIHPRPH